MEWLRQLKTRQSHQLRPFEEKGGGQRVRGVRGRAQVEAELLPVEGSEPGMERTWGYFV